jgi:hypothetical protein
MFRIRTPIAVMSVPCSPYTTINLQSPALSAVIALLSACITARHAAHIGSLDVLRHG